MTTVLNVELKLTKEEKEKIVNECLDILNERLVEELEKIRKEVGIKATMHQDGDIYIRHFEVAKIIDNRIKELKGENNE